MRHPFPRISVFGLGYIGLPTAATLASRGVEIIGVDINPVAVDSINRGKIHIVEPELDAIVHNVVHAKKLRATTQPEPADAFIIAVPTPFKGQHQPDLSYIEAASRALAPVLQKGNLVLLESTSPVGTTEKLSEWLAQARPDLTFPHQVGGDADVQMAYCPERVLPGQVMRELVQNDRIIGGLSPKCGKRARDLYKIFVQGECILTDARTAEMTKLTENSFRDVNIAFANEISLICDRLGINVWKLIELANRHPRVKILQPGPGVGGHCIAVDPWFIVSSAPEESRLIRTARNVNDHKPHYVLEQIKKAAAKLKDPVVACFGLSFKPDIDDLRESPALEIVEALAREPFRKLLVVEPFVSQLPVTLQNHSQVQLVESETAFAQADLLVMLVNHRVFSEVDPNLLEGKLVLDYRGTWTNRPSSPSSPVLRK